MWREYFLRRCNQNDNRRLKKAVGKAAGESKPEAYPQGYVEDFVEPRTMLGMIFNIRSLHSYTLGQIPRLIHIRPA